MSRKKFQKISSLLELGVRLREVRKKAGLSQAEIGKILGVGKSTISKFESDNMIPDMETLERYAQIGETTIERLLRGQEPPSLLEPAPDAFEASQGPPLDVALIAEILTEIKKFIAEKRLKLSPQREARLAALIYDRCQEEEVRPDRKLVDKCFWITKVD